METQAEIIDGIESDEGCPIHDQELFFMMPRNSDSGEIVSRNTAPPWPFLSDWPRAAVLPPCNCKYPCIPKI